MRSAMHTAPTAHNFAPLLPMKAAPARYCVGLGGRVGSAACFGV